MRDVRNGLTIPPALTPSTVLDAATHPAWWFNLLTTEPMTFANLDGRALVLASGNDVHAEGESVFLPPNRLAVLSHERVEAGQ